MKNLIFILALLCILNVIVVSIKNRNKLKHKQKKNFKERYRVESDSSSQQKNQLNDLIQQVINKENQNQETSEEKVSSLQQILMKINEDQQENEKQNENQNNELVEGDGNYNQDESEKNELRLRKIQDNKDKQRNKNQDKKIFEPYWQIKIPNATIIEQQQKNEKAQTIYNKNPQGSDKVEDSAINYEGNLDLKIIRKDIAEEYNDIQQNRYIRINNHAIYAAIDKSSGYRGIVSTIEFDEIFSNFDNTLAGKCCQNIYMIEEIKVNGNELYSFIIDAKSQSWKLSSEDRNVLEQWRNSLNGFIIVWDLKRKGVYDAKELKKKQNNICDFPVGYNYVNQDQWPCTCAEGLQQSPINLETKTAKKLTKSKTIWGYNKPDLTITFQNVKETYFTGAFGRFTFINEKFEEKKWNSNQVRFKFPSEHKVDGHAFDAEMQIVHSGTETDKIIISVFFKINSDSEITKQNDKFLASFGYRSIPDRKTHKSKFQQCIDYTTPNLIDLVMENTKWKMSFFTYMGSDTIPPCNENVQWFIYKEPLFISSMILNDLKNNILGKDIKIPRNNRDLMPLMDRKVELWDDPCEKEFQTIPPAYQYVKVEGAKDIYGIYKKDQELGFKERVNFDKKQLTMEELSDEQSKKIPSDVFDTLVKKFQIYVSGTQPETYDYYGKKSNWEEDYRKLVGDVQKEEAKALLQQKQQQNLQI